MDESLRQIRGIVLDLRSDVAESDGRRKELLTDALGMAEGALRLLERAADCRNQADLIED